MMMHEGDEIDVTLRIRLPSDASQEAIRAWLGFNLGFCGQIAANNPLLDHEIEAAREPTCDWRCSANKRQTQVVSFTLVFKGSLKDLPSNPFKVDTPYGLPIAAAEGDYIEENEHPCPTSPSVPPSPCLS